MLAHTSTSRPIVESTIWLPAADRASPRPPASCRRRTTFGSSVTSVAELDGRVDVGGRGVAHRDAVAHVPVVDLRPHVPFRLRELGAVVDPGQPAFVVDIERGDDPAVRPGELRRGA